MDIQFNNEYCSVTDLKGNIIIAEKLTGRVESGHIITKYTDLAKIPITKLPILKVGEIQEDDKLYLIDGKASIIDTKPIDIKPIEIVKEPITKTKL